MLATRARSWATTKLAKFTSSPTISCRYFSFCFAGPRELNDVIKKELVHDKTGPEVANLWFEYHESKESVLGLILEGKDGSNVLSRAGKCPFFVQPVFREHGFFMLLSQFQGPSHFLMAYLEDYKMDPTAAVPLLTFSVFDDYAHDKDVTLVRADILNKSIADEEGLKVVQSVLDSYRKADEFETVETFNKAPNFFDIDDHISRMNERWKQPVMGV